MACTGEEECYCRARYKRRPTFEEADDGKDYISADLDEEEFGSVLGYISNG